MAAAFGVVLAACSGERSKEGQITLRLTDDPTGNAHEVNVQLAREFEEKTGIAVEMVPAPSSATERLTLYLQFLGARSNEVDVYQIDVIWPGILHEHFVDLSDTFQEERGAFFQPIVANNTVGGKLAAIPWFADAGILYYRTDLLDKYGFDDPPGTWSELESMARTIQEGERAGGNGGFWGYVWQGAAYEGLTCNALEWIASSGGGTIVSPDGEVTIGNARAARALERASGWVGTISPPGVASYMEEEARNLFHMGQAAFMRNWPYAYTLMNQESSTVRGKFGIAMVPGEEGRHAGALGGWQLAVSKYSEHPEAAIEFVKFMTSEHAQKERALGASLLPARPALYDDPEIAGEIPFIPSMREVFENATPRPSTATGNRYNQISDIVFRSVHDVLLGRKEATEATAAMERQIEDVLEKAGK